MREADKTAPDKGKARPMEEAILAHLGRAAPANDNAQKPPPPCTGEAR